MAAGHAYLTFAAENDVYDHVNGLGERLREGITDICEDRAPEYTVVGTDSMFKTVFTRDAPGGLGDQCSAGCEQRTDCPRYDHCPKTGHDVAAAETERWERIFWQEMKDQGVFLTANQFESQFVSYAHTDEDVDRTLEAYKEVL
jgi:glutamate-1-semialdehyde 2,1-aminomutase